MIATFLLGLMGSLHCAGMCGPLVLLTPVAGDAVIASRLIYHSGRIAVYALIGLMFGVIGESIALAGFQRWLSLLAGILMILTVVFATAFKSQLSAPPRFIKSLFGRFLHQRSYISIFALGATNGLLPCGLVYTAATASIAAGSLPNAALSMIAFGMGTLPMLLAISAAGKRFTFSRFPSLQKLTPITVAVVALLLVWRGQPLAMFKGDVTQACPACAR